MPQTLAVDIPAGVDTGTRIRLAGKGEAGPNGAPAGDLYIFLHIARHKVFERDGTTLLTRAPISFTTAALGGEIEIPGLDGSRHAIEIPAGIQSGNAILNRAARREHQNRRRLAAPANLSRHGRAVGAGQHVVEDDRIVRVYGRGVDRVRAVVHEVDGIGLLTQPAGERWPELRVVFGEQEAHDPKA